MKQAYVIAKAEEGVSEIAGSKHNPRILEYHKETSLKASTDEVAWCASFVNWCLMRAGMKGTNSAAARSFLKWGRRTKEPQVGDIVVTKRGSDPTKGHVGFLAKVPGRFDLYVYILSGNQDNKVCVKKYLRALVLEYRTALTE